MPGQEVSESEEREAHHCRLAWVNLINPLLAAALVRVSGSTLLEWAGFALEAGAGPVCFLLICGYWLEFTPKSLVFPIARKKGATCVPIGKSRQHCNNALNTVNYHF